MNWSTGRDFYVTGEYGKVSRSWHIEDSPWKAKQIMRVFDPPVMDRPLKICEIGCGVGGVLASLDQILAERGVDAQLTGYDIAPEAIERAKQMWSDCERLEFFCQDPLGSKQLRYDVCLLIDILEHLQDPMAFLKQLRESSVSQYVVHLPLQNNLYYIMTGRTDLRRSPLGHVHFYDTYSGLSLLERSGLTVIRWVYTPGFAHRFHQQPTFKGMLHYILRKSMFTFWPTLAAHTVGGVSLMALCSFNRDPLD